MNNASTDTYWTTSLPLLMKNERGDSEKILAMTALGVGSFLSGMLPAIISERNRHRFPLTTSLLLCFGAGILLATAMVHILPEVRKQMSSNFAEIALCGGFFIIYFIDEFIHYFFGEAIQHTHGNDAVQQQHAHAHVHDGYGALNTENAPLLGSATYRPHDQSEHEAEHNNGTHFNSSRRSDSYGIETGSSHEHSHCTSETEIAEANARICHTSHSEPCAQSMTGTLGLFVALSLHSAIEGLAIGVQNSATKVLFLLGAVACHKFVMGFCLGLEFRSNPQTSLRAHLVGILVFALGAVGGIGLGMIIVDVPASWTTSALPVVQALAGGTLFYVTVCEVMPREKARWHQNATYKLAGFAQFLAIAAGFAVMCIINFYLDDDDT